MSVITHLYDTYDEARSASEELIAAGIPESDISIVANNASNRFSTRDDRVVDTVEGGEAVGAGAGIGAAVGGAAGLLAGVGVMAIPGIGPVVAAGWLASTALGAAVGGAAGGIIGALTQAGVPEDAAHVYAEGLRRGGSLLTVRVPDTERARIEAMLASTSVDVSERREAYESEGWKGFDQQARSEAERERRAREKPPLF